MPQGNAGAGETYTAVEENIPDDFPYMEPDDVAYIQSGFVEKIKHFYHIFNLNYVLIVKLHCQILNY